MTDDDGWVRFGVLPLRQRLAMNLWATVPLPGLTLTFIVGSQFVIRPAFHVSGWAGFVIAILALVLLLGLMHVLFVWLHPAPAVNFESKRMRVGRKTVALADIDTASLAALDRRGRRLLALNFGKTKGPHALVYVRGPKGLILSDEDRATLVRLLEATSIAMPTTPDDPTGRFARYNFPGHLDREAAINVVKNPPEIGDSLPVSY